MGWVHEEKIELSPKAGRMDVLGAAVSSLREMGLRVGGCKHWPQRRPSQA